MLPTVRDLCRSLGADFAPVTPSIAPAVEVSAVHVSELADPTAYLDGGELLLTTGLGFRRAAVWYSAYVERLARTGVAGLALGLGPVHASVPAELVSACERAGLPLLVVPAPTPFLTISRRYWSMIAESGQRELAEMLSTHRALVAAAVGASPVPSVLRRLAVAIDGWAAHLSVDGRLRAVWPPSRRSAARDLQSAVRRLHAVGAPTSLSLPLGDDDVVVQPIGERLAGYLAVGHPRPLPPRAQQLTMTAVALLTLESVHAARLRAAARDSEAVVLDLLRAGNDGAARQAGAFLGVELPDRARVALLTGESAGELLASVDRVPAGSDHVVLGGLLDLPGVADGPVCCLLVHPLPGCAGWLRQLVSAAAVSGARGVLAAPGPLDQLPAAVRRAAAALDDTSPGELADLALPGGLADDGTPLDTPGLRAWAERRLASLGIGEDGAADGTLADTLVAYLRSCSEQAAARELGVHRHTVRNRLSRLEACSALALTTRTPGPSCGSLSGWPAAADFWRGLVHHCCQRGRWDVGGRPGGDPGSRRAPASDAGSLGSPREV